MFATKARRNVENARLALDAVKGKAKQPARGMNPDEPYVSEATRAEIERKEDEFVAVTEEAVGVMKNVSFSFSSSKVGKGWLRARMARVERFDRRIGTQIRDLHGDLATEDARPSSKDMQDAQSMHRDVYFLHLTCHMSACQFSMLCERGPELEGQELGGHFNLVMAEIRSLIN